jgi:hypothetical protein
VEAARASRKFAARVKEIRRGGSTAIISRIATLAVIRRC